MSATKSTGRLTFRVSGNFWVASWAQPDTREGEIELGRIAFASINKNPKLKQQFMDLIKAVMDDFFEHQYKTKPHWPEPVKGVD